MARGDYGFNGRLSVKGQGTKKVRVISLDTMLGIISTSTEESKRYRAFYPIVTTGSSFTMTVAHISWEEREEYNRWMTHYMKSVSNGTAEDGIMTIRVPSHDFIRTAVPENEIEFGEGVTDVGYLTRQSFMGASNPLDVNLSGAKAAGLSFTKGTKTGESRFFYPDGVQVRGAEALDGTLFDAVPSGPNFTFDPNSDIPTPQERYDLEGW